VGATDRFLHHLGPLIDHAPQPHGKAP
jgi:hypothetical protein